MLKLCLVTLYVKLVTVLCVLWGRIRKPLLHLFCISLYIYSHKSSMWASIFVSAGRMVAGEKKSVSNTQYKRPYGCAVISVADLLTADFKDDHLLKIYSWVFKISPKLPGKSQIYWWYSNIAHSDNLLKYIANLWHIMFTDVMQRVSGTKSMTVLSGRSAHDTAILAQIQVRFHFACRLKGIVQQKIIRMNTMSCHSKPVWPFFLQKEKFQSVPHTVFGQLKNRRLSL